MHLLQYSSDRQHKNSDNNLHFLNNFPIVDFYNRKVFTSWKNASDNGFFSKSYWSKLKKRPNVECSAIVCLDTVVQKGLSFHPSIHRGISPIISCLNDNQFLLAKMGNWFPVFCVDQTVEKRGISPVAKLPLISPNLPLLSSTLSPPPLPSLPINLTRKLETEVKERNDKELRREKQREKIAENETIKDKKEETLASLLGNSSCTGIMEGLCRIETSDRPSIT
jgi:hypothetical protein